MIIYVYIYIYVVSDLNQEYFAEFTNWLSDSHFEDRFGLLGSIDVML